MTFICPACGEDLYARPARSYAELEGLLDRPTRRPVEVPAACAHTSDAQPQRSKRGLPVGIVVWLSLLSAAIGGLVGGAMVLASSF